MENLSLKQYILFYIVKLAIWHDFPDITHIKVSNGRKSAILNFIVLIFFMKYPSLNPHILFNSNGLAIWHGLPDITHIKVNNGRKSAILNTINLKLGIYVISETANFALWQWSSYLAWFSRYYAYEKNNC